MFYLTDFKYLVINFFHGKQVLVERFNCKNELMKQPRNRQYQSCS